MNFKNFGGISKNPKKEERLALNFRNLKQFPCVKKADLWKSKSLFVCKTISKLDFEIQINFGIANKTFKPFSPSLPPLGRILAVGLFPLFLLSSPWRRRPYPPLFPSIPRSSCELGPSLSSSSSSPTPSLLSLARVLAVEWALALPVRPNGGSTVLSPLALYTRVARAKNRASPPPQAL